MFFLSANMTTGSGYGDLTNRICNLTHDALFFRSSCSLLMAWHHKSNVAANWTHSPFLGKAGKRPTFVSVPPVRPSSVLIFQSVSQTC